MLGRRLLFGSAAALALLAGAPIAPAQMLQSISNAISNSVVVPAISRVGTATNSGNTVTVPAHAKGDLILVWATRGGSATAPSLPSGYSLALTKTQSGGTAESAILGLRIATATNDASGTWTNANEICCHVYRAPSGYTIGIGQSASASSTTSNTVNYPAITLADPSGKSWVAGFIGASNTSMTISMPPSGMSNESTVTGASYQADGHDTNGGVTSWPSTNVVTTGTATRTVSCVVEIMLLPNNTALSNIYQHVGGGGNPVGRTTGNGYLCPFPNTTGAGNCLVLAITNDGGATITSISDNINGTWPAATVTALPGAGDLDSRVYVFPNSASGLITITVTYSAAPAQFQYCMTELYGIATSSPGAGSSSASYSTTIGAGSFTPTNNDSTGGNFVWAYFAKATPNVTHQTTHILPGAGFTMLNADIGWNETQYTMTKAVEALVQTTHAAINPAVTSAADAGDPWNSLAVALQISAGSGTAPAAGIRVNGIQHFSTLNFPAAGNYNLQVATTGNLRVIQCPDPNLHALTITDSEGNTYTAAAAASGFWYLANAIPNPNLLIFITGGGGDNGLSWRFIDISGSASSPYDTSAASNQDVSNLSGFTMSPSPSPANSNGLVIVALGLGNGPGLAVTAPSGAIWDYCTYTGETDFDLIENADIFAHYSNSASGSETWTFTITSVASNSTSGGWIAFHA